MELSKIKSKIDAYFANISADELYELLTKKYGLTEVSPFKDFLFNQEYIYTNKEQNSLLDFYDQKIEFGSINNSEYINEAIVNNASVGFIIVNQGECSLPEAA